MLTFFRFFLTGLGLEEIDLRAKDQAGKYIIGTKSDLVKREVLKKDLVKFGEDNKIDQVCFLFYSVFCFIF